MAGVSDWRQSAAAYNDVTGGVSFDGYTARKDRYQLGWAYYEGKQYERLNALMNNRMISKALYKYIQDIYNPTARLVNFYKAVIWRGSVDQEAGDSGAIPINVKDGTDETSLRAAIARAFQLSNINKTKNIHVLHGASMGDGIFYIRDDVEHGESRIEIVHPAQIESAEFDSRGFVKSYTLVDSRIDNNGNAAIYRETCEHGEGENIIFTTYRDRTPYAWEGNVGADGNLRDTWVETYGFIPLVCTKHIDEGNEWGKSAAWNSINKIDVIEDLASILFDGVRKNIDPVILQNFKTSDADLKFGEPTATTDKPKPGRENAKVISVDKDNASMTPITVAVDIAGVSGQIKMMLDNLENELPELRRDIFSNVATDTVLAARADVESKVIEARINYDASMVSALQMTIAIGGMKSYEGYEGFDQNSYKAGKMNFSISERPVFPKSEAEKNAETAAFFASASSAMQASQGMITFEMVAKANGWTDEKIAEYLGVRAKAISGNEEIPIDPITGKALTQ